MRRMPCEGCRAENAVRRMPCAGCRAEDAVWRISCKEYRMPCGEFHVKNTVRRMLCVGRRAEDGLRRNLCEGCRDASRADHCFMFLCLVLPCMLITGHFNICNVNAMSSYIFFLRMLSSSCVDRWPWLYVLIFNFVVYAKDSLNICIVSCIFFHCMFLASCIEVFLWFDLVFLFLFYVAR